MSSEGSYPHSPPEPDEDDAPRPAGALVLDFPSDEVSSPGVPAGTWADDGRAPGAAESTERLLRPASPRGGQVVAFPRTATTHKRLRPVVAAAIDGGERSAQRESSERLGSSAPRLEAQTIDTRLRDVSGPQKTQAPRPSEEPGPRPAYLASELLKEDWWPAAPLARTMRYGAIVVGAVGAVAVALAAGLQDRALGLAGLLAACALAGLAPLTASTRGVALALIGLGGAGWLSWMSVVEDGAVSTPLLIATVTLCASALFFRAAHRQSHLARVLVAVGLVALAAWLASSGGLDALMVESLAWPSWVTPISRLLLGAIALAALLSFVDPTGHGGAWGIGAALLGWLATDAGATLVATQLPSGAFISSIGDGSVLSAVALPMFAAIAALGLCQVWVLLSRATRRA